MDLFTTKKGMQFLFSSLVAVADNGLGIAEGMDLGDKCFNLA